MTERLEELCMLCGISGREKNVREYIISRIEGKAQYSVDALGNLIVFKKGKKRAKNKVLLSAHMDEVGFIVRYITDDGYLKIAAVGGIDRKVAVGRHVLVGDSMINGIIGIKPVHLCEKDEENKVPKISDMVVDIGVSTREQAEKLVSLGDSVYFSSDFVRFGDRRVKAKAIDDRFGCAVMLSLIDSELEYDTYFTFVVQEEVGLRGSGVAAFTVEPDYAVVIEATTASDIAGVSGADKVCCLGDGAVVSFMDRSTVYDRALYSKAFELAKAHGVKCQTKTAVAGGNDAGAIHKSRGGVKTLTVSLPCRYIHSAGCVAHEDDMDAVEKLVSLLITEFADAETC